MSEQRGFWQRLFAETPAGPPAPTPGLTAVVSREPALVTIYAPDGATAQVHRDDLPTWLGRGFRLTRFDLRQEVTDLAPRFRAAAEALALLVRAAEGGGEIHPGTLGAAQVAVAQLAGSLAAILTEVQLAYRTMEGEPVAMVDQSGQAHRVDPGQVAQYAAQGWQEVRE